jgi:hypothetical protein
VVTHPTPEEAALTAQTNAQDISAQVSAALVRLRQIKAQATTFAGQAPYATANLANLNDLLAKTQLIAAAVSDMAVDLIALARIASNQFEAKD